MIYKHMNGKNLQSFYHITIKIEKGSKFITFHSSIHVNKAVECSICYGLEFTDMEILNDKDFVNWVHNRYGVVTQ